jgi:Ca2+-binding EF-hand superfamily protein
MFDMMDANLDGKVTAAEMRGAYKAITGRTPDKDAMSAEDKIRMVDTDGDGVLTASEHAAGAASMFLMMDADRDGAVTEAEMQKAHAAMLKKT